MNRYTTEFKIKVCRSVLCDGMKYSQAAEEFRLDKTTVYRWVKQYRKSGMNGAAGTGHLPPDQMQLKRLMQENELRRTENAMLRKGKDHFGR